MPADDPRRAVAVDVGGTVLKGAVVDEAAGLYNQMRRPTPRDGAAAVVAAVADMVAELRTTSEAAGLGVVLPGLVDEENGVALFSANLNWRDVPFRKLLSEHTELPVVVGHDVRAGGLAEQRVGAAVGASDALVVPIGTGIASAVIVDSRPVAGAGFAGEIGHVCVDPAGVSCGCGSRGCLETIASAAAIARRYTDRTGHTLGGAAEVAELLAVNDQAARAVWDEAVETLTAALGTATALLSPEVIVLGGGLAESGLLVPAVRARLEHLVALRPLPHVVAAALGDRAGVVGAGLLALDATGRGTR